MTESNEMFRTVLRGYDPAEVDRRVDDLTAAVTALTQQRDGLAARVEELHQTTLTAAEPAGFEHLGARVGQILALAESEAAELRGTAQDEAAAHLDTAHQDTTQIREQADRYSTTTQGDADAQAARIVEDARKAADEHRDSAERDASVRLQQAEAVYEEQRARAAKAAADFETTLAGRRQAAEDEFTQKIGDSRARFDEISESAERTRSEAETMRTQAAKEATRLADEARETAAQIIGEAKATAERIRVDTERELAAAMQRRDSINSQLSNVRQMLATLTGTAPFALTGFADSDFAEKATEPSTDSVGASDEIDEIDEIDAEPVGGSGEATATPGADDRADGEPETSDEQTLAHGGS